MYVLASDDVIEKKSLTLDCIAGAAWTTSPVLGHDNAALGVRDATAWSGVGMRAG